MKIIKIGGGVIDNEKALSSFLESFSKIEGQKILVHGGGKIASRTAEKMGVVQQMVNGRRITDKATLDIVTAVYGGLISKQIVAGLQKYGCNAVGLSGADGFSIEAHKRENSDVDYGFVGDVDQVNTKLALLLAENNFTPVFNAITLSKKGELLNTNADTIATELAKAFTTKYNDTELIFCFEKAGVLKNPDDDSTVIEKINQKTFEQLKAENIVSKGMLPKLENAFAALKAGVGKVIIANPEYIKDSDVKHTEISLL